MKNGQRKLRLVQNGAWHCIITATAPATLTVATLTALTPDYKVLTNQGDASVLVYIDSIAL